MFAQGFVMIATYCIHCGTFHSGGGFYAEHKVHSQFLKKKTIICLGIPMTSFAIAVIVWFPLWRASSQHLECWMDPLQVFREHGACVLD
jgi:hypothetical protein